MVPPFKGWSQGGRGGWEDMAGLGWIVMKSGSRCIQDRGQLGDGKADQAWGVGAGGWR